MALALFSVLGGLIALAFTASLHWNIGLYLSPVPAGSAVLLHVARTSVLVAALVGLALAGSRPFLAAVVGFACLHAVAIVAMRRWT